MDAHRSKVIIPIENLPPNTFSVRPPPPESVTKTIIVLDRLHYPSYPLVRSDLRAFLKNFPSGSPITIVRLDWQGLHLVQDFTSDAEQLRQAVDSKRMLPPPPPIGCPPPYIGIVNPYHRLARFIAGVPGHINLAWITAEGSGGGSSSQENYPNLTTLIRNINGATNVLRLSRVVPYLIKVGGSVGGLLQSDSFSDTALPEIIPGSHGDRPPDCEQIPAAQSSIFANSDLIDLAKSIGGHAFFGGTKAAMTKIMATGSDYYTLSYVPTNPQWNGVYRRIKLHVANVPLTPIHLSELFLGWTETPGPKVFYRPGYYASTTPPTGENYGSTNFGPDTERRRRLLTVDSNMKPATYESAPSPWSSSLDFGTPTPNQLPFTIAVNPGTQVLSLDADSVGVKENFLSDTFLDTPVRNYRIHYWIDGRHLRFTHTYSGTVRDDLEFAAIVYGDDGFSVDSISIKSHIEFPAEDLETILAFGITFDQTVAIPIHGKPVADHFYLRLGVLESQTGHIGVIEIPTDNIQLPPDLSGNSTILYPP